MGSSMSSLSTLYTALPWFSYLTAGGASSVTDEHEEAVEKFLASSRRRRRIENYRSVRHSWRNQAIVLIENSPSGSMSEIDSMTMSAPAPE
jgi:hypothetical protein